MVELFGPYAAGAGFSLGQDPYANSLGPMLQGDGVFTTVFGDTTLQVRGNSSGMQVLVGPGVAMVRGVMYSSDADVIRTIGANASGSTRIDRVVLRNDRNHSGGGLLTSVVIVGTPGAGAPAYTQSPSGFWDIPLAQVTVGPGVSGINPGDVTDERQYLPLKIPVIDSRTTSPTTVAAKILYDKNPDPNIVGLWENNGTLWKRIRPTDTGWQNIGVAGTWIPWSTTLQYRIIGNRCYIKGQVAKDVADGNPDIAVGPAVLWPTNWSVTQPVSFPCSVWDASGVSQQDWSLQLINELPSDVRLSVRGVGTLGTPNYVFSFNFNYLLD